MKQQTISDIEYSGRKRKTKREHFLDIMEDMIPWAEWIALIIAKTVLALFGYGWYDISGIKAEGIQLYDAKTDTKQGNAFIFYYDFSSGAWQWFK